MEFVPTFFDPSPQVFLLAFVVGAAVLAMWLYMRVPDVGPTSVGAITLHMVIAVVGANMIVPTVLRGAGSPEAVLAATFAIVLPLVLYMFLAAIWLIRFGVATLSRYSR